MNDTLSSRIAFAGFWGRKRVPGDATDPVKTAFTILDSVAYKNHSRTHTQWRIVFDITARKILFRTLDNPALRHVDLASLDFSCKSPVQMQDINVAVSGDIKTVFEPCDYGFNRSRFETALQVHPFKPRAREERLHTNILAMEKPMAMRKKKCGKMTIMESPDQPTSTV